MITYSPQTPEKHHSHNQRGFTLLEMLVAVFIFSISLVALATISSRGIVVTQNAVRQTIAHFLAQEGIEMIESYRDDTFLTPIGANLSWPMRISDLSPCMTSEGCYAEAFQPSINSGDSLQFDQCSSGGCPILLQSASGMYGYTSGDKTPFIRTIWLSAGSSTDNNMIVISRVEWKQGATTFSVEERKNIFNWF
ncbi:hypothetical protein A2997_02510 [Candidatus Nomurabacteria bacterium RIFCSPLOWO2_01_FULL_36_10b]|uniref:Type II secretion system protein n=1 Tax=Candidatus Nomurabacteria bacterium RIFCSPLOWO2_01_FULL_36_10b TaxID=1801766 RepID=A0A1F6WN86_9BACT|nr:MAG: hypothetical protein A2997_02510 [Candidatus Nomurabacteria bacterium RIFCSPLOWO2_01_FULL_36_10b]